MALTDLDAQIFRIRDPRSRLYFGDAVRAFRAGAHRSAISAAWVSVAYDLIRKYRELQSLGDGEAREFVTAWDSAVQRQDLGRLLKFERELLRHASERMGILDAQALRTLSRLYEDRHLCAHPAFANPEELFEPSEELVRAHLSAAIDLVLSQKPVQGRGIFEAFDTDVQSPGFPNSMQAALDYVEDKYLAQMRDNIIRNFGAVLAKSVVWNIPVQWHEHRQHILAALTAVKHRRPDRWQEAAGEIVRLINDDDPNHRLRSASALSAFPELTDRIDRAAITAITETLNNDADISREPSVFSAIDILDFRDALLARFQGLDDVIAAGVLRTAAPLQLWPEALRRYAAARSFRGAETRFDQFIAPFQPAQEVGQLSALLEAIGANGQIWDAALTPSQLHEFIRASAPLTPSTEAISNFYGRLPSGVRENFQETWRLFERLGWARPQVTSDEEDIPF